MAELTRVDDWEWTLYKVEYSRTEDSPVRQTRHIVSTPEHVEYEVTEYEGVPEGWVKWTAVKRVERPPKVGEYYGLRIDMDGWTYGRQLIGY